MHLDVVILALTLIVLTIAIAILGLDLLLRVRHKPPRQPAPEKISSDALEPQQKQKPEETEKASILPAADPASLKVPPTTPKRPEILAFSTIQDEIKAALRAATQEASPSVSTNPASLNWSEQGRLAVLSLGDSAPESAWPLLQAQGIHILIVPQLHPFPAPNRSMELLCLPDNDEAELNTMAAGLRAKLVKGERIAFYTETGLTGPAALLAARLSSRSAT